MESWERTRIITEAVGVVDEVVDQVLFAAEKHGDQMDLPLGTSAKDWAHTAEVQKDAVDRLSRAGLLTWTNIAMEEIAECFAEEDPAKIRAEALQAAAMFVQIVRRCDRASAEAV